MSEEKGYRILEDIAYYGNGEPFWKLDLALPADAQDGKCPAVLIVHGGGFEMCTIVDGLLSALALRAR